VSDRPGFLDKHYFLLRRLHSLTGIVPIGVFLIAHLTTNSSLAWGKFGLRAEGKGLTIAEGGVAYFQEEVAWINTQVPHLLLIEISLWGAIFFHSGLGIYYAMSGRSNTARYAYQDNWRYTLQRISGYLGFVFILYHVATLRWGFDWLVPSGTVWSHHFSASTLVAALKGSTDGWTAAGLVVSLAYFVGVSLLVFHFANGLWTAAITWGLTISVRIAEAGLAVDLFSMVPVKRSTASAPRAASTPATRSPASRATASTSTSTKPSTAATSSPTSTPSSRWPTGPPRSSTCSTAWASPSTAPPRASATCASSAARSSSAPTSPARPPASSSSTPSTSRPAATSRGQGHQVRVLGVPLARHRGSRQALRRHRRPGHAHHADPLLPGRRGRHGHRRVRPGLRQEHQLIICTGAAAARCYQAGVPGTATPR
jgi:succinate dehydrogenase / fumarate reductase cytochrome b subunit